MNKKPNITSVTYERLVNLGNYENERLSATVDISLDEPPEEVFEYLYRWVNDQLKTERRVAIAQQRLRDLEQQEKELRYKINLLKNQIGILQNQINSLIIQTGTSTEIEDDEDDFEDYNTVHEGDFFNSWLAD